MAELVADCPRCGSKRITFDLLNAILTGQTYGWQHWYEAFSVCRHCHRSTVFVLAEAKAESHGIIEKVGGIARLTSAVNTYARVESFISSKDASAVSPPEHLPEDIDAAFNEAARCLVVGCWNAAGAMFRLCLDLATRPMLPEQDEAGLNRKVRRDLGLRLPWLFETRRLPESLRELSSCVKDDGNDAAHAGTLKKEDAEDLMDFTVALLERLYTEPERLRLARERREKRRQEANQD